MSGVTDVEHEYYTNIDIYEYIEKFLNRNKKHTTGYMWHFHCIRFKWHEAF